MNEQEILTQLRKAAEEIEIPEALKPEQIEKQLQEQKAKQQQENQHLKPKKSKKIIPWRRLGSMVAVLALVVCSGIYITVTRVDKNSGTGQTDSIAMTDTQQTVGEAGETEEAEHVDVASLGTMYHRASDYKEVYQTLLKGYQQNWIEGEMSAETSTATSEDKASGNAAKDESADMDLSEGSKEGRKDYSTTNLQMEGVDESDIAKIDGSYIYTVEDKYIVITDIRDGKLEEVTRFLPKDCGAADRVMEIYVDGDQLILVVQGYETSLGESSKAGSDKENSDKESSDEEIAVSDASEDSAFCYKMNGKSTTQIQVYSIVDRKNPEFEGRLIQDGYYNTSRKIGDVVYLFTQYNMTSDVTSYVEKKHGVEDLKEGNGVSSLAEAVIPKVNGEKVAASEIYLPESSGESGILVSSLDVNKPDKVLDSKLVISGYAQTYISKDALYLYEEDYDGAMITNIAKFALDEGRISGVAAAAVSGYVRDTFAINASDGYLRVLTTDYSTEDEVNALYILDENMKLTGQLTGIAPGEEIYAARFMGNTGYFVTYRNTDPLFTVDLSDPAKPEIIGELKVTGFSEYLHFWDDTHLLGIGYESDENTGNIENIKLSMFNIENPGEVTEEAKLVLKDVDYSEALYDYKSVIISKDKNLIGLVCEDYSGSRTKQTYQIYSYENGIFKKQAEIPGINGVNYENVRGMYSGNVFYLWINDNITSYDMTDGFKMLKERE
ncbi:MULTISPECIES: beta-propeller domain-containing protein [Roseburia]|uniref:beta-propeller domain-containing protein n=1 Tax=Roseburia TaxID=841 RepID=UPI001D1116DB|nr:beta-propeller domain-containing protein [Roseburia sp. CLA-AA-H209]MCC2225262.1 beta-propeller domain-containing protein [Roseburia sp. CLA-AA-H209]